MAIKNTDLGGTDWISTDTLDFTDVNDTFNAITGNINITHPGVYNHNISSDSTTTNSSYTTLETIDLTGGGLDLESYSLNIHLFYKRGTISILVTDVNDNQTTYLESTAQESYASVFGTINSATKIKTIVIQGKCPIASNMMTLRASHPSGSDHNREKAYFSHVQIFYITDSY